MHLKCSLTALALLAVSVCVGCAAPLITEPVTYYARCNLKVIKGSEISWINWQAAPSFIPAGTALLVTGGPQHWKLEDPTSEQTWNLDTGADGLTYLEKFVSEEEVSVDRFPQQVRDTIRNASVRTGMTKEQVYVSLGPPMYSDGLATNQLAYEDVMKGFSWLWARRRPAKKILVQFDHATGNALNVLGVSSPLGR